MVNSHLTLRVEREKKRLLYTITLRLPLHALCVIFPNLIGPCCYVHRNKTDCNFTTSCMGLQIPVSIIITTCYHTNRTKGEWRTEEGGLVHCDRVCYTNRTKGEVEN